MMVEYVLEGELFFPEIFFGDSTIFSKGYNRMCLNYINRNWIKGLTSDKNMAVLCFLFNLK